MIPAVDEGNAYLKGQPMAIQSIYQPSRGPAAMLPPSPMSRPHYHKYLELLYAYRGDIQVYIDNQIVTLREHSMILINSGESHSTARLSAECALIGVKFLPGILFSTEHSATELEYSIPSLLEHFPQERMFSADLLQDTFIPGAFGRIMEEHNDQAFGYELAIRAETTRIMCWILRRWHAQAAAEPVMDAHDAAIMRKARHYVRDHLSDATLRDVASHCCLSYSYFSRLFKRCMQMPFARYLNLERVNASMQELLLTDKSITDIALGLGFASTSHYIQTFRQLKNISPNRFRKTFAHGEQT